MRRPGVFGSTGSASKDERLSGQRPGQGGHVDAGWGAGGSGFGGSSGFGDSGSRDSGFGDSSGFGGSGFGDSGLGDSSGFGDSGSGPGGWGSGSVSRPFHVPRAASVLPLVAAILLGVLGIGLSQFATPTSVILPLIGWALCAVGDVLLVAVFQMRDLRAAAESMAYRSSAAAGPLRVVALALAAVGIVLNSMAIAGWVATR